MKSKKYSTDSILKKSVVVFSYKNKYNRWNNIANKLQSIIDKRWESS